MPELYFTKKGVEVSTSVNLPFIGIKLIKETIPYSDFGKTTSSLTTTSWIPVLEGEVLIGLRVAYIEESLLKSSKQDFISHKKSPSRMKLPEDAKPISDFQSKVFKKNYTLYETNDKYYLVRTDKELKTGPMAITKTGVQKLIDYVNKLPDKTLWVNVHKTNTNELMGLSNCSIWIAEQVVEQKGLGETFVDEKKRLHFKLKPTIFMNKDNPNTSSSQYQSKHSELGLPPASDKNNYNKAYYEKVIKPKNEENRKSPLHHTVRPYYRSGKLINAYERGKEEKTTS